jgi:hypothetical protein
VSAAPLYIWTVPGPSAIHPVGKTTPGYIAGALIDSLRAENPPIGASQHCGSSWEPLPPEGRQLQSIAGVDAVELDQAINRPVRQDHHS